MSANKIQFVQINLQHAKASTHLLCAQLTKLHTFIALIQEPWVLHQVIQGLTTIPNTQCFYLKSNTKPRAAIVTSSNIMIDPLPLFASSDIVAVFLRPNHSNPHPNTSKPIVIASVYLPIDKPNIPDSILENLVTHCKTNNLPFLAGCDSNAHNIIWGSKDTNRRGERLLDFLLSNDLEIANQGNEPTFMSKRGQSLIDITMMSPCILPNLKNWHVSTHETLSDHKQIEFELHCDIKFEFQPFQNPKKLSPLLYFEELTKSTLQIDKLNHHLRSNSGHNASCIDNTTDSLTQILGEAFNTVCPQSKSRRKGCKSWWNKDLEKLRHSTRSALQKAKRSRPEYSECNWEHYRTLRRDYKTKILEAKTKSWQEFCTNTEGMSATAKIQKLLCKEKSHSLEWVYDSAGNPTDHPMQTIQVLLDTHFPSNSPFQDNNSWPIPTDQQEDNQFDPIQADEMFSIQKIKWAVKKFEPYKSPGPDGIYPICLQLALPIILPLIKSLFISCLQSSYLPQIWRQSKVIFIPKPGKSTYYEPKSYRPISLSCFLLKTMERLIELEMKSNWLTKFPLSSKQHAYTADKSTDSALHVLSTKLNQSLRNSHSTLCAFLDIQGAFDHTSPKAVTTALGNHHVNKPIINLVNHLLTQRSITINHKGHIVQSKVSKGCPQGGILSPLLWNLVANDILQMLTHKHIWCLGYADDIVVAIESASVTTCFEVGQFAISLIEKWCQNMGLSVNPDKAELLLVTRKRKFNRPNISIFGKPIQLKTHVKYLGVYFDQKLTWSHHVSTKVDKALQTLWLCRRAVGSRWGLGPVPLLWILQSIIHPLFLHGIVVWWEATTKSNHITSITKINRSALMSVTGAFKTTPTAALEVVLNIPPLELKAQQFAQNSWYRLLRTGAVTHHCHFDHKIHQMLIKSTEVCIQPADFTQRTLIFPNVNIQFTYPSKESWLEDQFDTQKYDICAYTDGSSNELGVGAGIFIWPENEMADYDNPNQNIHIPLSNTTTVFQAEMLAISTAAHLLLHNVNKHIAILSDSLSAIQSLENPEIRTKTKLDCINNINKIAVANQLALIWVPGHSGIQGNERADELANTGAAVEYIGPSPIPPIPLSFVKSKTKEWMTDQSTLKWRYAQKFKGTKEFLDTIDMTSLHTIRYLQKPLLTYTINTITGHGSFRSHLVKLKLSDEPSCPYCGSIQDTNIHYVYHCPKFTKNRHFSMFQPKPPLDNNNCNQKPNKRIKVSELWDFIRSSQRFDMA